MKTIRKTIMLAAAAAAAITLSACSDKSGEPEVTAATAPNTAYTVPSAPVTEATTTAVTEPPEDLTSIPTLADLSENIAAALNSAGSFEMACNVKGFVPDENYFSNSKGEMVEHSFTLTTMKTATHLVSNTKDLNTGEETSYEEYQTLKDNIVTTITPFGSKWVDNTPKEMIRYDMLTKSYASLPVIGIFANGSAAVTDVYASCSEITRSETGEYIITVHGWDIVNYDGDFGQHGFSGLFRSSSIGDILANTTLNYKNGDCTYVFSKDFRPVSISFDIFNPDNYNAEFYGLDLHGEVRFSKWDAIGDIYLPKVSKVGDEPEESETTAAKTVTEPPVSAVVDEYVPAETEAPQENTQPAIPPAITTATQT